jgi:iron complex outermembrane receptor protein
MLSDFTNRGLWLVGASLLAIAVPAAAQDNAPPANAAPASTPPASTSNDNGLGEIVVTAQFRAQNLQDTPLSITAVNAGLLESRSQTNISQVANQAPNVTLIPAGAVFGPSIGASIRGVGQFDFNPAYEPGVGLYIDDVYYATLTGGVFDLLDLDRVEILRGPQGTLTGRNSEGGAIKLFTKKPSADEGGFIEGSYGNRNKVNLRASADFKLTDTLFGRIAGVYKQQDGYIDQLDYGCVNPNNPEGIPAHSTAGNCRVAKLGETSHQAIRGQLRWNPSDKFDVTISGDYAHEDRTNAGEVLTFADDVSGVDANGLPVNPGTAFNSPSFLCGKYCNYTDYRNGAFQAQNRSLFKGGGVSANATWHFNDTLSLTSITAYRRYLATFGTDDDFTPNPFIEAEGDNRLRHHFFSEELRLNGKVGDFAEFTLGGFYSKQKTTYYTRQDIGYIVQGTPGAPGAALQFIGNDPVKADSKAVFGTVILHPTDALTLTGGLRYTKESKDYTFSRRDYDGGPVSGLAAAFGLGALDGLTSRYRGDKIDYRASIDYRLSPQILAYATISTGFKGGGVSARPFNATQALQGTFKPETLTNYEIGLKNDLFDRRLRVNLSGFINRYKDIQIPLADCTNFGGGPCGVVANAGNARFKGVELEVTAEPIDGLSFDGSASYLKSKFTSLNPAVGANLRLTDPATPSPRWKWSWGVQYEADLGTAGSVTPRFDMSYNGKMYEGRAIGGAQYFLPAYTLANARLTWRNENKDLSISAEATNLFNKYYYNAIFSAVYAFTGTAYEQVGRPREYGITINKKF